MVDIENTAPVASGITETSPLLADPTKGLPKADARSNGHPDGTVNENGRAPPNVADQDDDDGDYKIPEMRDRMHLLIPAVGVGIFLVAIDQLLTVATYAKIGSELNALNNTSWIATAYLFTITSFQPLYGKLSDIFGRKECLLFCYTVFAIGSLGCGLAQDIQQLCIARAIAGIGGGGMTSIVSILLSDIVSLRDRGVYQGYINMIYSAGTSIGAPLGGLLADSIGWRWSFMGQAPLCFVAIIAVYFVLQMPPRDHDNWVTKLGRIDFAGAFTLIAAVISMSFGLDSGANSGWSNLQTIISLAITPVLFAIFILIEMRFASNPFAPGHIIFERSLFACYLTNFFATGGQFGVLFFMPLYFQAVMGLNATQSGALLVPGMIASVTASVGAGIAIKKTGKFHKMTIWSFGLLLASVVPLAISVWKKSLVGQEIGLVMCCFGGAYGITTTLIGMLANSAAKDSAVVISCSYLFRSLGSSIGVSISAAVLQQVLRDQLAQRLQDSDTAREVEEKVRQSLDFIAQLPPLVAEQVRTSYQMATLGAYLPTFVCFCFAFIATFRIREKALQK